MRLVLGDGIAVDTSDYTELFLAEARARLGELDAALAAAERGRDLEALDEAFRAAHSLKGMGAAMGLDDLAAEAHRLEDALAAARGRGPARAGAPRHVAARASLLRLRALVEQADPGPRGCGGPGVPAEGLLRGLAPMARALAASLGKRVDLRVEGGGLALGREIAGALADPLVHLVRNAVDHGVEPPAERLAAGKAPAGRVDLAARAEGDDLVVEVRDDGRGLDPGALRRAAVRAGVIGAGEAAALPRERAEALALHPGVTTAASAGAVSGRGVGMDAVRSAVAALGGSLGVSSARGAGTTVAIRVPGALRRSTPAPVLTRK